MPVTIPKLVTMGGRTVMPPAHDDVAWHGDEQFQNAASQQPGNNLVYDRRRVTQEKVKNDSPKKPSEKNRPKTITA